MVLLDEQVEAAPCDGIVIFASPSMLAKMRRFQPWSVSRRLIAEIADPLARARGVNHAVIAANSRVPRKVSLTADTNSLGVLGPSSSQAR